MMMALRIFIFMLCVVFISGCHPFDEAALKEELKDYIDQTCVRPIDDVMTQVQQATQLAHRCTVSLSIHHLEIETVASGVLISQDGSYYYVLTNAHVLHHYDGIKIITSYPKATLEAEVVEINHELDLAILKVYFEDALSLCVTSTQDVEVGQWVIAVGTMLTMDYSNVITFGILSRLDETRIQHDAAINHGSSGGGLFNLKGELIGINQGKISTSRITGTQTPVEGMSFAIPLSVFTGWIESVLTHD